MRNNTINITIAMPIMKNTFDLFINLYFLLMKELSVKKSSRNKNADKIQWHFNTDIVCEKLISLYPKFNKLENNLLTSFTIN